MRKSPLAASESSVTWRDHQCHQDCCAALRLAKALKGRNLAVQQQMVTGRSAAAYSSTELNSDQDISYSKRLSSPSYYQAMALLSSVQTPCQSHHLQEHRNFCPLRRFKDVV